MLKTLRLPAIAKPLAYFMLFSFMIMINGCYYFKVVRYEGPPQDAVSNIQSEQRYLILHVNDKTWHFTNISVDQDSLTGYISSVVGPERTKPVKTEWVNRYKNNRRQDETYLLNEAHMYVTEYTETAGGKISIPLQAINKIEIYDKAHVATIASWVFGIYGVVGGVTAIVLIIWALTKSSCPFVYQYNGESYAFAGEIYGGATYPSLERDDYMPLPDIKPINDKYRLLISNELKEQQFTNMADLMIINHPYESKVLIDKYGQIQTLSEIQKPSSAISLNEYDVTNLVTEKDNSFFLFDEHNDSNSINGLILTFENPNNSKSGKLVINAKNSLWADYGYNKFTELFGTYYTKWNDEQKQVPAKTQLKRILDQDIPLSVFIEKENGWEFVDFYNVVGPLGARDIVMPINFSGADSEEIRIKLETGFMFWELDYAGIDFSENIPCEVTILKPDSVVDNMGNNLTSLLSYDDNHYLTQMNIGDEAYVSYSIPEQIVLNDKNNERTVFLHTKGFYEAIREYKNEPDWSYLFTLQSPHSLSKFSYQEYERTLIKNGITIATK